MQHGLNQTAEMDTNRKELFDVNNTSMGRVLCNCLQRSGREGNSVTPYHSDSVKKGSGQMLSSRRTGVGLGNEVSPWPL